MLKEKETTTPEVRTIKLSTGEEIIAEFIEFSGTCMKVKRPLTLVLAEMPGAPQQTQVVFTPWMLALEAEAIVKIERTHILSYAPARKDAAEQYVAATRP